VKEDADGGEPAQRAYRAAAEIVGYCMIGSEAFSAANDRRLQLTSSGASTSR
jgi:hypothetical protein